MSRQWPRAADARSAEWSLVARPAPRRPSPTGYQCRGVRQRRRRHPGDDRRPTRSSVLPGVIRGDANVLFDECGRAGWLPASPTICCQICCQLSLRRPVLSTNKAQWHRIVAPMVTSSRSPLHERTPLDSEGESVCRQGRTCSSLHLATERTRRRGLCSSRWPVRAGRGDGPRTPHPDRPRTRAST